MGCILGWLILLPFAGAIWLGYKIVDACIKKGGSMRVLGILVCIIFGGGSIYAGYFIGPIVGWFIMAIGGLLLIVGIWRSLTVTKEEVELEELQEKLDKESKELAKEVAKKILERDKIDNYEEFNWVCDALAENKYDGKSIELLERLKQLKKKQAKSLQ
ncbi:MAG: hypothetical protein KAV68_01285 [Dehalococcoidales bacterium]|nr:hypothetical protein [Dehalococcoidales bacterium]